MNKYILLSCILCLILLSGCIEEITGYITDVTASMSPSPTPTGSPSPSPTGSPSPSPSPTSSPSPSPTSSPTPTPSCSLEDGVCFDETGRYPNYCSSPTELVKYYCIEDACSGTVTDCNRKARVCSKTVNACVKPEEPTPTCTDSDGRDNFDADGNVTYDREIFVDYCDGNIAFDYYCLENEPATASKNCADEGMACENGVCKEAERIIGLVAYWKFDEGLGIIAGDSVNENHGTVYGEADWRQDCVSGSCLNFDGDYFVNVPYNASLDFRGAGQSFTISTWIYKSDLASGGGIIGRWLYGRLFVGKQQYFLEFEPNNNSIKFTVQDDEGYQIAESSANSIAVDRWHYVVAVADEGTLRVYVDSVASGTRSSYGTIKDAGEESVKIGTPVSFVGLMDEIKVYNKTLTAEEIRQEYEELKPTLQPTELPNAEINVELTKTEYKTGEQVKLK